MTYVATFNADIKSEITDSLNADTNTYVPKFTVKAHTATGNLRKTLESKYVIKTAKGDSKNETKFTIYVEDPKCDSPTGTLDRTGESKYNLKQVLGGADKTQVLSPYEIKEGGQNCPFTIKWANKAGANVKMDPLVTFAADTRTVTFKGSTNDSNGKALMGKYTYEAKWYNQKDQHVTDATTTVNVILDETKCLTANWKPVFNKENLATVVNSTGF